MSIAEDAGLDVASLLPWITSSLEQGTHRLSSGYQGNTLLYDDGSTRLVIKTPHGNGLTRMLHVRMLRHERDAYRKLADHPNVPRCYGLVDNSYLVLEYIDAPTTREQTPGIDSEYHQRFFDAIAGMHDQGVAHIDLKRKDNVLVKADGTPVMIDFGTAIIYRQGFHPINHYLFDLGKRFDWNAWIKHKYRDRMESISEEDMPYYNRTWYEKLARAIKKRWRALQRKLR